MTAARIVKVNIIQHRETGLFLGTSEQMRGLYAHGRSLEELESRLAPAIQEILEAEGKTGVQVLPVEDADAEKIPSAFVSTKSIRKFALAA